MSSDDKDDLERMLKNVATMMTMDGPLLTANVLLSALRDVAHKSLAHSVEEIGAGNSDPAIATKQAAEVQGLMVKIAAKGMRDLFTPASAGFLGWDEIKKFIGKVADEHNAWAAKSCNCPNCKGNREHQS